MKRIVASAVLAAMLIVSLSFGVGQANTPASKAAAQVADFTLLDWKKTDTSKTSPWETLLSTTIKTSMQKDLVVDASLESGLYTKTVARSKDMITDTSFSRAGIEVRVLIDGKPAYPGTVTFGRRSQELSATLQGQLALIDKNADGIVGFDELVSIAPEEIGLVLDTLNANSFNFVLDNVGTGVHKIELQARIDLGANVQAGSAEARAMVGKGSMTVEEVRMIRGADLTL